ncbi:MAG: nucleotidyltransferase domain-containing protein [Saprospiraceae bacterium]|uniref:Nucleotidyltransferase domain-containing protein n=1 Tax=Candidatus Opimibacter skivensis TaxID=2982028 RepID=A0A9D7SPL9_9BACT|nr:nucleotidyltransferase domain-containing protein [Candidatus Opimibacter skivensis]
MEEKISGHLNNIEVRHDIKILLACETGSRAWGFPSPDSDFDVRLIYMHKKDWYLSLNEKKDTIELMLEDNEIDISGWDIRKSLRLLYKSNPPLLERIQSPIIYRSDPDFLHDINDLANLCYSKIATMHHYLSMSKKILPEIEDQKKYKLKKFFYALRSSLACRWIIERNEIPPIQFEKMVTELNVESNLQSRIKELIELKSGKEEAYFHTGENDLLDFIRLNIDLAENKGLSLPSAKSKPAQLDVFFINILNAK